MASIGLVDRTLYVRGIGNNFIYDYIRRRVRLEPGSQDYFMRDVDFDRGRKVSKAPPRPSARERLRPGEVEIDLVAIDGGPPEDEPAPPSFDHLIVPEDLQLG